LNKGNTLGRSETADRVNALAFIQVDHFHSVIAQRTNKQSLAANIDVEVIDPPFHPRQRNRLLQLEGRARVFLSKNCGMESY
jgi:hypothetical protein